MGCHIHCFFLFWIYKAKYQLSLEEVGILGSSVSPLINGSPFGPCDNETVAFICDGMTLKVRFYDRARCWVTYECLSAVFQIHFKRALGMPLILIEEQSDPSAQLFSSW